MGENCKEFLGDNTCCVLNARLYKTPKTQKECVLFHLIEKPLTMPDAVNLYNIYRLADIVFRLKKDGHNIITEEVPFVNRYGHPGTYARYKLIKPIQNANNQETTS